MYGVYVYGAFLSHSSSGTICWESLGHVYLFIYRRKAHIVSVCIQSLIQLFSLISNFQVVASTPRFIHICDGCRQMLIHTMERGPILKQQADWAVMVD